MAICSKLKTYLDGEKVSYRIITHPPAFTMQEVAAASHISGSRVAKSVMVKANGGMALCVLPSTSMVDFSAVAALLGAPDVTLATEEDFSGTFEECEIGAFCPFGHLYQLPIVMDEAMWRSPNMAFNAGTHRDLVEMEVEDYCRLSNPQVGPIGRE